MDDDNAHPGFAAIQNKIAAKEGVSKAGAGAILAKTTRNDSAAAKAKNPRLGKVTGGAIKRRMNNAS